MRAMILAAGLGTRMRPLTDLIPKPLLTVVGKPLIEHQIEKLVSAGVTELVINISHLGQQIEAALGDGSRWGVSIDYSPEDQPLETAGGLVQALPLLTESDDRPFLVVNADVWCDYPLQRLSQLSMASDTQAHLLLVDNPGHNLNGDFGLFNGHVANQSERMLTFAGLSLLRPSLLAGCEPGKRALAPLLRQAVERGRVSGERYPGYWLDVGTPERLAALEQHLQTSQSRGDH